MATFSQCLSKYFINIVAILQEKGANVLIQSSIIVWRRTNNGKINFLKKWIF